MNIAESNHNATDLGRPLHGYRAGHQILPKSLIRLALQVKGSENFGLGLELDLNAQKSSHRKVVHAVGVDDDVRAVRLEDEYRVFDDEVLLAVGPPVDVRPIHLVPGISDHYMLVGHLQRSYRW